MYMIYLRKFIQICFQLLVCAVAVSVSLTCETFAQASPSLDPRAYQDPSRQFPTYMERSGLTLTCFAQHPHTFQTVRVIGINGQTGNAPSRYFWDESGSPVIVFDANQLSRFPDFFGRFVYYQSCAGLQLQTPNSVAAACDGLKKMRSAGHLTLYEEQALSRIIPSYVDAQGGDGLEFWQSIAYC